MIIIGDELIEFEPLLRIKSSDDIKAAIKFWQDFSQSPVANSPVNLALSGHRLPAILAFSYDRNLIKNAKKAGARMAIFCKNKSEALISNAAGAKLIISQKELAKPLASLAEYYLFDAKIACIIKHESELESLAEAGVDVAIFENAIINL